MDFREITIIIDLKANNNNDFSKICPSGRPTIGRETIELIIKYQDHDYWY